MAEGMRPIVPLLERYRAPLVLIAASIVLTVLAFRDLPLWSSYLTFGDLPGFYNYPPLNVTNLLTFYLYPLTEQSAGLLVGAGLAHNLMFVLSFFLPPIGIYTFLRQLIKRRMVAVGISIVTGSILNPVQLSILFGGGYEYGLWLFFSFVSLAAVFRGLRRIGVLSERDDRAARARVSPLGTSRPVYSSLTDFAVGGLLFGLSVTSSGSYNGLAMALPLFVGIPLGSKLLGVASFRRLAYPFATFVFAALGTMASWIAVAASSGIGIAASSSSALSYAREYAFSSISFTFQSTGPAYALLNGFPAEAWAAIVIAAVIGGILGLSPNAPDAIRIASFASVLSFFVGALMIVFLWSGVATSQYVDTPGLGSLDSPVFFRYMETISLPAMLLPFVDRASRLVGLPIRFRTAEMSGESNVHATDECHSAPVALSLAFARPGRTASTFVVVCVLVACGVASSASLLADVPGEIQSQEGSIYYAPASFASIHTWYTQSNLTPGGYVLVLPDTLTAYNEVSAFVPSIYILDPPLLASALYTGYNETLFYDMMVLLAGGQASAFGNISGVAGVNYILILNQSREIQLAPATGSQPALGVDLQQLEGNLSAAHSFLEVINGDGFIVYRNANFLQTYTRPESVTRFENPNYLVANNTSSLVVHNSSFSEPANYSKTWGSYLSTNVQFNTNGTFALDAYSNSTVPNTLLWLNLPSGATEGVNGSPAFNESLSEAMYHITISATVSPGLALSAWIYWYDTHDPANFFSQVNVTTLKTNSVWGEPINESIEAPAGAVLGRLVFQDSLDSSVVSGSALIRSLSVYYQSVPERVAQDTLLQTSIYSALVTTGLMSSTSLFLPYPLNSGVAQTDVQSALSSLVVAPLSEFYNGRTQSIVINLTFARSVSSILSNSSVLFVTAQLGPNSSINVTSGGEAFQIAEPRTGEVLLYHRVVGSSSAWPVEISTLGMVTVGVIGGYMGPTNDSSTLSATVSLPRGHLQVLVHSGSYQVTRNSEGQFNILNTWWGPVVSTLSILTVSLILVVLLIDRSGNRGTRSGHARESQSSSDTPESQGGT